MSYTATQEEISAAWSAWKSRHGDKLGPGPAFVEAINAALSVRQRREDSESKDDEPVGYTDQSELINDRGHGLFAHANSDRRWLGDKPIALYAKPLYSHRQIEARVKSLEEALKPVAEKYDSITPDVADVAEGLATHPDNMQDEQIALITLRIGDLRRARTALASTGGEHHAE